MRDLKHPTPALIDSCIKKFENDNRYNIADKAIVNLFNAFPTNKKIEDILLKISVINDLYSTNIFGTYRIAIHIQKLNLDNKLKIGDPKAVNDIAKGHGIKSRRYNKEINFYSFATKYCNWHNQEKYAIYDRFVDKILMAFKRKDQFSKFTNKELKDFQKFKRVIFDFQKFYNLTDYSLKEIDKFLWVYGKEKFPNVYKNQENI